MNELTGLEIAVIGMAGRFPGAGDISEFWENLVHGKHGVRFFTDEELTALGVQPQLLKNPLFVKAASIIDNVESFDAAFFGYTPREAEIMAPQIRIFHECVYHAFEDAGYVPYLYEAPTGLYAGSSTSAHWEALAFLSGKRAAFGEFATNLLADKDQLCTRISYNFNLKGPSFTVATACSTSLVAIHLACQGLLSGECKMAAAGGVTVTVPRNYGYLYKEGSILPVDGYCRAFDAAASGSVLGEGAGVVILKSLEDAQADRDFIYAIIKGSAINNDGSGKVGYTAPSVQGQATVIRAAMAAAEVEAESIGYVETHGTGTKMGDPIEFQALALAFNTTKKGFCRIGAVKSNVGHLVHAAGVTGFIKTVLSLHYRLLPPSLHFTSANPQIDFANSPFYVNTKLTEWQPHGDFPLRAGVSSFGIGGTNAHVILEEAPGGGTLLAAPPQAISRSAASPHPPDSAITSHPALLLLSAKTGTALEKMTHNLAEFFRAHPGISLADAAYTLQVGRMAYPYRRMLVVTDNAGAARDLHASSKKPETNHIGEEKKTLIFMFAGLGSQYVDMGRGLYEQFSFFREEMNRCFAILDQLLDYDMRAVLYAGTGQHSVLAQASPGRLDSPAISRVDVAQIAVFIIEYALAKLLMSWGIKPQLLIGYSFGEYAAACIAGVFSLPDALSLIVARGKLIAQVPTGLMLSVPLPAAEVQPYLDKDVSISIDNGPSCIVSGPHEALVNLENRLKDKRYLCYRLPNSHAIHSRMMEPILADFAQQVGRIALQEPAIPFISNVTGQRIKPGEASDPAYWCRHMRETVRFAQGIELLKQEPGPLFIEIGPGRDLSTLLVRHREESAGLRALHFIRSRQQEADDVLFLLKRLGRLWLYGVAVNWQQFYRNRQEKRYRLPLPKYPFARKAYWIDGASIHDGLGLHLTNPLPAAPGGEEESDSSETADGRPPGLSSSYAPASGELEEKLLAIWQGCFGFEYIGVNDDFFELGGDSLLAATMVSRLQQETGIPFPLVEVFNLLTIRKMVAYAGERNLARAVGISENLVFLESSPNQNAANLFLIHDISGDVEGYIEFCKQMQLDFNCWGIRAQRIENYAPMNVSVQQLAAHYLNALRTIQSRGPYYLAGWSFGGYVAFEMARLLEELGETVAFLAPIDAFVFKEGLIDSGEDFSLDSEIRWLRQYVPNLEQFPGLAVKLSQVTGLGQFWSAIVDYLETEAVAGEILKQVMPENMSLIVPNFDRLTSRELIFSMNMLRTFNRSLSMYQPSGQIQAPLHFFKASRALWEVKFDHWQSCTTGGVTFHDVPGDHFSIFAVPDVNGLVQVFEQALGETDGASHKSRL